jgi:hypothetical protein
MSPAKSRNNVDLPQPDGPSSATNSPAQISHETPVNTRRAESKETATSCALIKGAEGSDTASFLPRLHWEKVQPSITGHDPEGVRRRNGFVVQNFTGISVIVETKRDFGHSECRKLSTILWKSHSNQWPSKAELTDWISRIVEFPNLPCEVSPCPTANSPEIV